jgi:sugar phosphate isomerase/epimerase
MRLGISSYTYNWAVGVPGYPPENPLTAEALLQEAATLGVRVVQIADNLPLDALAPARIDALAALAAELQLDIEIGTAGIAPEHLQKYLDLAIRLRAPLVRTVIDTATNQPSPAAAIGLLGEALPEYRRAGVTIAVENHDRFPARTLERMIERLGSEHLGICLDTANSLGCGEDLQTLLGTLGRWVVNLHVKDFCVRRLPHKKGFVVEGCPAGTGLVDIPVLLNRLRELGRDVSVILEHWPPPQATVSASIAHEANWTRQSLDYLRQFVLE